MLCEYVAALPLNLPLLCTANAACPSTHLAAGHGLFVTLAPFAIDADAMTRSQRHALLPPPLFIAVRCRCVVPAFLDFTTLSRRGCKSSHSNCCCPRLVWHPLTLRYQHQCSGVLSTTCAAVPAVALKRPVPLRHTIALELCCPVLRLTLALSSNPLLDTVREQKRGRGNLLIPFENSRQAMDKTIHCG